MELILLQKVANLGNIGDRIEVKSGYGRNYLLPQGKATLVTLVETAITEPSPMARAEEEGEAGRRERDEDVDDEPASVGV